MEIAAELDEWELLCLIQICMFHQNNFLLLRYNKMYSKYKYNIELKNIKKLQRLKT